jgi:hypothetical protein
VVLTARHGRGSPGLLKPAGLSALPPAAPAAVRSLALLPAEAGSEGTAGLQAQQMSAHTHDQAHITPNMRVYDSAANVWMQHMQDATLHRTRIAC